MNNLGYTGKLSKNCNQCTYEELYGTTYCERDDDDDEVRTTIEKPKNHVSFVKTNSSTRAIR